MHEFTLPQWVNTVKTLWGLVGAIIISLGIDISFLADDFFTTAYLDEIISGITILIGAAITFYNVIKRGIVKPGTIVKQSELVLTPAQKASFWNPFGRQYAIS